MLSGLKKIDIPSEKEFILVDDTVESSLPLQGPFNRIPLMMWIDYGKLAVNPPSVTFLINPATMGSTFTKKVNTTFTRGGFIVEDWGDNLDVINFSGSIGAYYVLESNGGSGLNRYDRNKSNSFRNLMEVLLIYRNNGAIFLNKKKSLSKSEEENKGRVLVENAGRHLSEKQGLNSILTTKTRIASVGDVYIHYDQTLYLGSFDSLTIDEEAGKPYNLAYSFSFTVLRRSVSDNRSSVYYNQIATEFSDYKTGRVSDFYTSKANVQNYIKTEKSSKQDEATTNPGTLNSNISNVNVPSYLLQNTETIIQNKGYILIPTQRVAYFNSFKALQENQTYSEDQKTKKDIEDITKQVVSTNKDKSADQKIKDVREITDNAWDQANAVKVKGI